MSPRIVRATALRVLAQLRGDRRTVALLLVVPGLLLALVNQMLETKPEFDRVALLLLGIFPFTMMFLVTSVAMLRERTSGTLERLFTTPMSTLDLLLGYACAFALAAAVQAAATCATAYGLLGLYTPGSPWLVVAIAVASAVLGMALGLLSSAFATSEFQAVQFMPAVVMPQILLGGLFVPRDRMAGWLRPVSDALPLTYTIEALGEVGRTSLVTSTLLADTGITAGAAVAAVGLAATTLRRRTGDLPRSARGALLIISVSAVLGAGVVAAFLVIEARSFVSTDNAQIDGDRIRVTAPVSGTLVGWRATVGSVLRTDQPIGRIRIPGAFAEPEQIIRAPADGTVARDNGRDGTFVPAGAELAVAYDLSSVFVTARVEETDVVEVRVGRPVEIVVDAYPDLTLNGQVIDIGGGSAAVLSGSPPENTTGNSEKITQVVPVRIAILDRAPGLTLVPGINAAVRIARG
jgi:ABC transporter DrrB family efflux protein